MREFVGRRPEGLTGSRHRMATGCARAAPPRRTSLLPLRWLPLLLTLWLAACATAPRHAGTGTAGQATGTAQRDGPEASPPADLERVPDAVPKLEPLRIGGPNKPYEIDGRTYVPVTDDRPVVEKGLASWYGKKFHGRRTASGEAYNMYAMTAAHKTLPIPSYARVRNPANGREIIVRVNDRGPFASGRVIDLSYTAALKLGVLGGVAPVEVERITPEEIRTGNFARPPAAPEAAQPSPQARVAQAIAAAPTSPVAQAAPLAPAPKVASLGPSVLPSATPAASTAALDATIASLDLSPAPQPAPPPGSSASPHEPSAAAMPRETSPASPSVAAEQGRAATPAAAGFWLQLGAYRQRDGALNFQHRLADEQPWLAPLLAVFSDKGLHRLQAGPYATREEAQNAADRIREALQLVPTLVEKR